MPFNFGSVKKAEQCCSTQTQIKKDQWECMGVLSAPSFPTVNNRLPDSALESSISNTTQPSSLFWRGLRTHPSVCSQNWEYFTVPFWLMTEAARKLQSRHDSMEQQLHCAKQLPTAFSSARCEQRAQLTWNRAHSSIAGKPGLQQGPSATRTKCQHSLQPPDKSPATTLQCFFFFYVFSSISVENSYTAAGTEIFSNKLTSDGAAKYIPKVWSYFGHSKF